MFPLLSSQIVEFIAEKARRRFLLLEPDVSSRSLPVLYFVRVAWGWRSGGHVVHSIVVRGLSWGFFFFAFVLFVFCFVLFFSQAVSRCAGVLNVPD